MKKAVYALFSQLPASYTIDSIAIDAMPLIIPGLSHIPVHAYPKGETWSYSIAAASIIAKVTRDELMASMNKDFPAYSLHSHKGYGTAVHQQGIITTGASLIHRASFLKSLTPQSDQTGQTSLF